MASSSSSRTWKYPVFANFHEEDVRTGFLSRLREALSNNGIAMFEDQQIERGDPIAPAFIEAIGGSRISIVVFTSNYASSRICLDELVEILKCRKRFKQSVIPLFYGVDPIDVRKQTGHFGEVFREFCVGKTRKETRRWSQALEATTRMMGFYLSPTGANESKLIRNIVREVSKILKAASDSEPRLEMQPLLISDDVADGANNREGNSESWYSTGMVFLAVINLLLEIASLVLDELSSVKKPHFARISLLVSIISLILSIVEFSLKIREEEASFRCKWPIPWFYYPSNRIFGSFTDTVLLFCVVSQFILSTINYIFIENQRDGPIDLSLWPVCFAIGIVIAKFVEKRAKSKETLPITHMD